MILYLSSSSFLHCCPGSSRACMQCSGLYPVSQGSELKRRCPSSTSVRQASFTISHGISPIVRPVPPPCARAS